MSNNSSINLHHSFGGATIQLTMTGTVGEAARLSARFEKAMKVLFPEDDSLHWSGLTGVERSLCQSGGKEDNGISDFVKAVKMVRERSSAMYGANTLKGAKDLCDAYRKGIAEGREP